MNRHANFRGNCTRGAVLGCMLAAALAGCESNPILGSSENPVLTDEEIKVKLVGNSFQGSGWDGPYTVYFPSYGEMRAVRSTNYRDEGTWKVENDQLCGLWDNWWGHVERCWRVYRDGKDYLTWYHAQTGGVERAKVVPGNPADLQAIELLRENASP